MGKEEHHIRPSLPRRILEALHIGGRKQPPSREQTALERERRELSNLLDSVSQDWPIIGAAPGGSTTTQPQELPQTHVFNPYSDMNRSRREAFRFVPGVVNIGDEIKASMQSDDRPEIPPQN